MKKTRILGFALCAVMTFSAVSVPIHAEGTTVVSVATAQTAKKLTAPKVSVKSTDESSVKLSWNAIDGADKYQIYYSTKKNGTYKKYTTTAKTTATVKNLKASTTYYFKVCAIAEINGETVKSDYSIKKSQKTESTQIESSSTTPPQSSSTTTSTTQDKQRVVYIAASGNGKKYHGLRNCSKMNGNVNKMTVEEAEAADYTPCKKCGHKKDILD